MGVKQPEAHLDLQKVKGMGAKSNDLMGHLRVCRSNHTMEIGSSTPANPIQLHIMDSLFYEVGAGVLNLNLNFQKCGGSQHFHIKHPDDTLNLCFAFVSYSAEDFNAKIRHFLY